MLKLVSIEDNGYVLENSDSVYEIRFEGFLAYKDADSTIQEIKKGETKGNLFKINTKVYDDNRNNRKETFYYSPDILIKQIETKKGEFEFDVIKKDKLDLIKYLLREDIIIFDEPLEGQEHDFEKGLEDFFCNINTSKLNKSPTNEYVIEKTERDMDTCLDGKYRPDNWDVVMGLPYKGLGYSQELVRKVNEEITEENEKDKKSQMPLKRLVAIRRNTAKRGFRITARENLDGEIKDGDRILVPDDILGSGKTMDSVVPTLQSNTFLERELGARNVRVIGCYFNIDLQKKLDGEFVKDRLQRKYKIPCESATTLENFVDVLYVYENDIFDQENNKIDLEIEQTAEEEKPKEQLQGIIETYGFKTKKPEYIPVESKVISSDKRKIVYVPELDTFKPYRKRPRYSKEKIKKIKKKMSNYLFKRNN